MGFGVSFPVIVDMVFSTVELKVSIVAMVQKSGVYQLICGYPIN